MIRVGSQLTFCSPDKILRRAVVELNEQNIIKNIFSLDDLNVESSHTLFYDGIMSAEIVSVKQQIPADRLSEAIKDYHYLEFSEHTPLTVINRSEKPLIIDFETESTDKINSLLPYLARAFSAFSLFEIIAACTFYPSILLGRSAELSVNQTTRLMLWENADLVFKRLTVDTFIQEMSGSKTSH